MHKEKNIDVEYLPVQLNEDIDNTVAFLKEAFEHDMNAKVWQWEFNTFPDTTVAQIMKHNNNTVGTQFMLPIPINIAGKEILSGKCENTYLADNFKGTGTFEKLFNQATESALNKGMQVLWAFTPATKVYGKKFGYEVFEKAMYNFSSVLPRPSMQYFKKFSNNQILNLSKFAYYTFLHAKNSLSNSYQHLKLIALYSGSTKSFNILNSVKNFSDFEKLYSNLGKIYSGLIHIHINESYYNWRITNNKNLNYLTRFFYREENLIGYYLVALNTKNEACITDFTYLDKDTSFTMIQHLFKEFSNLDISAFYYFGNMSNKLNESTFKLLKLFGGKIEENHSMPFVYKEFSSPSNINLKSSANWYLNGLWTEGFKY